MKYIELLGNILIKAINCLSCAALGAFIGAFAMYVFALGEYEKLDRQTKEEIRKLTEERDHAKQWECFELKFEVRNIKDNLQDCREKLETCDYGFKQCKFIYKQGDNTCSPGNSN